MYVPEHFASTDDAAIERLLERHDFATLVTSRPEALRDPRAGAAPGAAPSRAGRPHSGTRASGVRADAAKRLGYLAQPAAGERTISALFVSKLGK